MPVKTISLIAFSTLALASAASADEVTFTYSAADLQSTAGVEKVYERMERRAESLCNTSFTRRAQYAKEAIAQCADGLIEDWVNASGDARLNALHASTGRQTIASAE